MSELFDAIQAAYQRGFTEATEDAQARIAELKEQLRLANIDAANEMAENGQLREEVATLTEAREALGYRAGYAEAIKESDIAREALESDE